MLHSGHNEVEGVPVEVVRKRIRRINIRVAADGTVCLSVPKWWAQADLRADRVLGMTIRNAAI